MGSAPHNSKIRDKATRDRILRAVRLGATHALAAQAGGIGRRTLYDWLERGKQAPHGVYREFHDAFNHAEASGAEMALAVIAKAARGGQWQAAGWLLERRYGYKRASELHVVDATEGKEREMPDLTTAAGIAEAEKWADELPPEIKRALIKTA